MNDELAIHQCVIGSGIAFLVSLVYEHGDTERLASGADCAAAILAQYLIGVWDELPVAARATARQFVRDLERADVELLDSALDDLRWRQLAVAAGLEDGPARRLLKAIDGDDEQ